MIQSSSSQIKIQSKIVDFVAKNFETTAGEIQKYLKTVTRPTLSRHLKTLKNQKVLAQLGEGRSTKYCIARDGIKSYMMDLGVYDTPYSTSFPIRYNHNIFQGYSELFTKEEATSLEATSTAYQAWKSTTEKAYQTLAMERCAIEFSWKSSKIEGNTYSLLETENLIKNKQEAKGKSHDEAVMILNQKKVFDLIYRDNYFTKVSLVTLTDIHTLLVKDLGVPYGIRKAHVGITGTQYSPPTLQSQLNEALESLFVLLTTIQNPLEKAVIALASIAYIQPFADGNKRLSRHCANALLHVHGLPPVAWRTVDEVAYKKAMIAFYELGNIRPITEMWVRHYIETTDTFFRST